MNGRLHTFFIFSPLQRGRCCKMILMKKFVVLFAATLFAASGFAQTKVAYLDLYMRGGGKHLKATLLRDRKAIELGRRNLGEVLNELAQEGWEVDHTLVGANRNVLFPTRHKFHIILKRVYEESEAVSTSIPRAVTSEESVFVWAEEKKTALQRTQPEINEVFIPEGETLIDGSELVEHFNLVKITLPESTVRIRSWSFWDCDRLKAVSCLAQEPPKMGLKAFPENIDIYVPISCVDRYRTAPGWSKYANRIIGRDF